VIRSKSGWESFWSWYLSYKSPWNSST